MKELFLIVIMLIQLLANDTTVIEKKIDMGNKNYAYIDYDEEWNCEGTLRFSKNLQCYILSSGNMSCMDGNYNQEIISLKSIIFSDVNKMITTRKKLSKSRIENYQDIYENFEFKNTTYEGLFGYLIIVNNQYSKTEKLQITQDVNKILSMNYVLLDSQKQAIKYNDMAYFLQQFGANKEASFLLEKILEKFPNRTVAYLNLGDAYWGLGDTEKAKAAYQTYIKQMQESGKEEKIPKVVLERVK